MNARFCFLLAVAALAFAAAEEPGRAPFRFAFSTRMFSGVNENDAKAAVRAWAQGLAKERNLNVDAQPVILQRLSEIIEVLQLKQMDCVSLTTDDYLKLPLELQTTNLLVSSIAGKTTEQYLLLVHAKSGIAAPSDLKGRNIVLLDHVRASLAAIWLDVLLAQQGLARPAEYFNQIRTAQKLTAVVLPVFFRQQDACIVTRSGFETMSELNPQLRTQLKPVAVSPELVPAFTFLRPDYHGASHEEILGAILKMHHTASGTQILTLFQTDHIEQAPSAVLDSARDLISAHQRIIAASPAAHQKESRGPTNGSP